jgi:ribosomal protein RSM22 (predicted rRNA methylase)
VRTAIARVGEWLARAAHEGWRYDVVLVGGLLNEVASEWEPVLERIARVLDPDAPGGGVAIVVEPAIPAVARKLMALRETALEGTTTIAPCTHGGGCPLLPLRKDWCFSVRAAELPPTVAAIAQRLRHQTREVRYALWSFAGRPEAAPFEVATARHARVVSDVMEGEQVLCVEARRERARTPPAFARGDLVVR